MSQQPMNLRRAFELIRRNKAVVGGAIGLGLIIGAAFGSINPPQLTSSVLVVLPNTKIATNTMVILATSDPVLSSARPNISPAPTGIVTLRQQCHRHELKLEHHLGQCPRGQRGRGAERR